MLRRKGRLYVASTISASAILAIPRDINRVAIAEDVAHLEPSR
jgi:hypothetical protein